MTYWCYCKGTNDASWDYCNSPETPVPEQINLQHTGTSDVVVASFVTFNETGNDRGTMDPPQVRWGLSPTKLDSAAKGLTRHYVETGPLHRHYFMHFVKLSPLNPRTRYYYQVRSAGSEWSETVDFRSLYYGTNDGGETRVAIFGDMGVYSYNNMANLDRNREAEFVDAIVHLGDHAYNIADNDGRRGDGYLNAFQHVIARMPWIPVLGNHEMYSGDLAMRYVNQTWGVVVGNEPDGSGAPGTCHNDATPLNSMLAFASSIGPAQHGARACPPSNTSRYYSADVGLIHFVSLDLNTYYFDSEAQFREPQLEWFRKDLAAAAANRDAVPWIVVMSHYPIYCSSVTLAGPLHNDGQGDEDPGKFTGCWSYGSEIQQVRADLEPLFQQYRVDMYLAGHEHDYESIWPITNNTVTARSFVNPAAPVHVVTGAGGAPALDKFGDPGPFTRKQLSAWGYGRLVTSNASELVYEHYLNIDDSLYDRIVIQRD
jgi:hypothetical protein